MSKFYWRRDTTESYSSVNLARSFPRS